MLELQSPPSEPVSPPPIVHRTRTTSRWGEFAPLPLRLMMGSGFLYHGVPKVFSVQGHQQFASSLAGLGIPWPGEAAWGVGLVEVLGGVAFLVGALVGLFAVLTIVDMLFALFLVHLPNGFNSNHIIGTSAAGPRFGMPGYELNLLYIAALMALLLAGPGRLSVEKWWARNRALAAW